MRLEVFFVLVFVGIAVFMYAISKRSKQVIRKWAVKLVVPGVIAFAVTAGLLILSMNVNIKLL